MESMNEKTFGLQFEDGKDGFVEDYSRDLGYSLLFKGSVRPDLRLTQRKELAVWYAYRLVRSGYPLVESCEVAGTLFDLSVGRTVDGEITRHCGNTRRSFIRTVEDLPRLLAEKEAAHNRIMESFGDYVPEGWED